MDVATPTTMTPLDVPPSVPISYAVFDGLRAIQSTQYEHSFAARIYGHTPPRTPGLIAVDWESHPPWTLLMGDIRAHYALAQSVDAFTYLGVGSHNDVDFVVFKFRERPTRTAAYSHHLRLSPALSSTPGT